MHTYYGVNGFAFVAVDVPGKGVWAYPQVPDDGNDRDAASVGMGIEACQDNIIWLAYHQVDGLLGGTYPGVITWTGAHTFNNTVHVTQTSALDGNVTCGAGLTVGGNATFNGLATHNDKSIHAKAVVRSGADAYEAGRKGNGPDTTGTVNIWQNDLWTPTITADRSWTLGAPPNDEIVETTIILDNPGAGHVLSLLHPGNPLPFAELGALASFYSVILKYDGSAWRLVGGIAV